MLYIIIIIVIYVSLVKYEHLYLIPFGSDCSVITEEATAGFLNFKAKKELIT